VHFSGSASIARTTVSEEANLVLPLFASFVFFISVDLMLDHTVEQNSFGIPH
jgi:hypothetical protein